MHMLSSRRNEAEADWFTFRNEAEAIEAAAENRRNADYHDAITEADAIEAEQAAQAEIDADRSAEIDADRSVVSPVQPSMASE